MRRTVRRRAAAGLVAALSLLLPAALPALAAPPTGEIVLDGATSAEGMAAGEGTTFMPGNSPPVISSAVTSAKAPPPRFIHASQGRAAVGMKADTCSDLLFVAGGGGLGTVKTLKLSGPAADLSQGFNLNGIAAATIKSGAFNVPTTVALFGNTLAVVNGQFNQPPSPFEVVLVLPASEGLNK